MYAIIYITSNFYLFYKEYIPFDTYLSSLENICDIKLNNSIILIKLFNKLKIKTLLFE